MRAALRHASIFHKENLIRFHQGGEPVRNNDRGAAREFAVQVFQDARFRARIYGGERVVQEQDGGVAHKRSRQRHALPLPARKVVAVLAADGLQAVRHGA